MTGISTGEVTLLAARFPWKRFESFIDMGCAQGALPVRVALTHPHLRGAGFDLPVVEPIFTDYVKSFGLDDRLRFIGGDFFTEALPSADVISFGHVFHGQSREGRCELVAKARDALPDGGALIIYDAMTTPRPVAQLGITACCRASTSCSRPVAATSPPPRSARTCCARTVSAGSRCDT